MLQVRKITDSSQFEALEEDWRSLSAACPTSSVFNGFDWQWQWWQVYGHGAQLCILAAYDDEHLCALLPLYIRSTQALKVKDVRELRMIGSGGDTSPDYLGLLYRESPDNADNSDASDEVMATMIEAIAELKGWDVAHLTDLYDLPEFNQNLQQALGKQARLTAASPIRYINLNNSFDEYLSSLSSNQRKQVRRRRRRFEEQGETRFYRWPNDKSLDDAFHELVRLHNKRWNDKDASGSFNTPNYLSFHNRVMHALQERDELRLYCLEHNEQMIAIEYSYRWKDSIFSFQCGFDPIYSEYRPGQLLLNYSIEDACEEGISQYDLLKGDYDYKQSAAKEQRQTYNLLAFRNTSGGKLASFRKDFSDWKQRVLSA